MENTGNETTTLDWISHPAFEEPWRNLIVLFFLIVTALALWLGTGSINWAVLGVIALLFAVRQWFIPTHYRLDEQGVQVRVLCWRRRKNWSAIKRASTDRNGVLLSAFAQPSRLDAFRGMFLRFSGNREQVMAFINHHLDQGEE